MSRPGERPRRLKGHHRDVQEEGLRLPRRLTGHPPRDVRAAPRSARRSVRSLPSLRRPHQPLAGHTAPRTGTGHGRRGSPIVLPRHTVCSPRRTATSTCWRRRSHAASSPSRSTRSGDKSRRSSSAASAPARLNRVRRAGLEGSVDRSRAGNHLRHRGRPPRGRSPGQDCPRNRHDRRPLPRRGPDRRQTFTQYAEARGKGGERGTAYVAEHFRILLESLDEEFAAEGIVQAIRPSRVSRPAKRRTAGAAPFRMGKAPTSGSCRRGTLRRQSQRFAGRWLGGPGAGSGISEISRYGLTAYSTSSAHQFQHCPTVKNCFCLRSVDYRPQRPWCCSFAIGTEGRSSFNCEVICDDYWCVHD